MQSDIFAGKRNRKLYRRLNRILSMFLAVMLVMACCCVPAFADDEDPSFYKMSSVASAYLSNQLAGGESGSEVELPSGLTAGTAGGLLGYSDEADQSNVITKWFMSALSGSSASFSYDSMAGIETADDVEGNPLYVYCKYGQMLSMIGFDQTATENHFGICRVVAGAVLMLFYQLANFVSSIFGGMTWILKVLNPFRLVNPNHYLKSHSAMGFYATDDGQAVGNNPLGILAGFLTKIYNAVYDNIVPIMVMFLTITLIARLLFGNLNGKSGKNKARIRSFIIRVTMMILGVPLIGMLYTDCLDALMMDMKGGSAPANKIVMSTLLDFETWAKELRLGIPDNYAATLLLDNERNAVGGMTYANMRTTCYNINCASMNLMLSGSNKPTGSSSSQQTQTGGGLFKKKRPTTGTAVAKPKDSLNSIPTSYFTPMLVETVSGGTNEVKAAVSAASAAWNSAMRTAAGYSGGKQSQAVADMIDRYMKGTYYYSGSYESDVKAAWTYADIKESVTKASGTVSNFQSTLGGADFATDKLFGGDLKLSEQGTDDAGQKTLEFGSSDGLSIMAMYNYLTAKFDASNVVVYSSEKAASGLVRESHFSVNLIGGNMILAFLYWANAVLMLFGMFFLGVFYAFAMVFGTIKRLMYSIPAMFGTVAGSIQSGAKLLAMSAAAIVEIVMTMVVYSLSTELLLAIDDIVMIPMTALNGAKTFHLTTGHNVAIGWDGGLLQSLPAPGEMMNFGIIVASLIVSCIAYIGFLWLAVKVRKSLVSYVNKSVGNFIDSLFGTKTDQIPDSPGLMGRAAQGAVAGAGAGLAHKLFSNDGSGEARGAAGESSPSDGEGGDGGGGGTPNENEGNSKDGDRRDGQAGDAVDKDKEREDTQTDMSEGSGFGDDEDHDVDVAAGLRNADSLDGGGTGEDTEETEPAPEGEEHGIDPAPDTEHHDDAPDTEASKETKPTGTDSEPKKKAGEPNPAGSEAEKSTKTGGDNDQTRTTRSGDDAQSQETDEERSAREAQEAAEAERLAQEAEKAEAEKKKLQADTERERKRVEQRGDGNGPMDKDGRRNLRAGDAAATKADGKTDEKAKDQQGGQKDAQADEQTREVAEGEQNEQNQQSNGGEPIVPAPGPAPAPEAGEQTVPAGEDIDDGDEYLTADDAETLANGGTQTRGTAPAESGITRKNGRQNGQGRQKLEKKTRPTETVPNSRENGERGTNTESTGTNPQGPSVKKPPVTPVPPVAPGVEAGEGVIKSADTVADSGHASEQSTQTRGIEVNPQAANGATETIQNASEAEPVPVGGTRGPAPEAPANGGGNPPQGNPPQAAPPNGNPPKTPPQAPGDNPTKAPAPDKAPDAPPSGEPPKAAPQAEKREARPDAPRAANITGTINGKTAEGRIVRNADGSLSGEMHVTEPEPSLTASKQEAGIVSAGIDNPTGTPGKTGTPKRKLTDTQRIAAAAAAAAFMSGSKNEFVQSVGDYMGYELAADATEKIIGQAIPKYGDRRPGFRRGNKSQQQKDRADAEKARQEAEAARKAQEEAEQTAEQAEIDRQAAEAARRNKEKAAKREEARRRQRKGPVKYNPDGNGPQGDDTTRGGDTTRK